MKNSKVLVAMPSEEDDIRSVAKYTGKDFNVDVIFVKCSAAAQIPEKIGELVEETKDVDGQSELKCLLQSLQAKLPEKKEVPARLLTRVRRNFPCVKRELCIYLP